MSNLGLSMQPAPGDHDSDGRRRPPKRRRKRSGAALALVAIVVLAVLGGLTFGGYVAWSKLSDRESSAADYSGPGTGEVVVVVEKGQTLSQIGETLHGAGVVASVQAFTAAAAVNDKATSIMPGSYVMLREMSSTDAVARLLEPGARHDNAITVVEGMRVTQVVALLSEQFGIPKAKFNAVLASPTLLPLPSWAKGTKAARAEGFLFPATYTFDKDATAEDMLNAMVAKFNEVADEIDLVARAKSTGHTPYDILTIASLIQAEAKPRDFGKVSRVISNRLNPKTWGGTYGYLQLDATLNYALDQFETNINKSDLATNSPYNTGMNHHAGLPPTPIGNPGTDAIDAALEPTPGDWLYYVTVNLDTGETKFTSDYDEFLRFQRQLREWEAANPQD